MKRTLIAAACLFGLCVIFARVQWTRDRWIVPEIAGTIYDASTNKPIASANIVVENDFEAVRIESKTDSSGQFHIAPVKRRVFRFPGDFWSQSVLLVSADSMKDFSMKFSMNPGEAIVKKPAVQYQVTGKLEPDNSTSPSSAEFFVRRYIYGKWYTSGPILQHCPTPLP